MILVVEDDRGLNNLMQMTLQKEGLHTCGVFNGEDAIAKVMNSEIDLIVLDYSLPHMNGYNVIKALEEDNCNVPFIVLTGQGNEEIAVKMMKLGAREYIVKDLNLIAFLPVMINKVLREIEREREYAHIEETIQEKSYLNQVVLDSMPCITLLLHSHSYEIIASNASAEKIGAVPGKKCYETWWQRKTPCSFCKADEMWESGKEQHIEVESSGIIMEVSWVPVFNGMYLHYAFDITDRRELEKTMIDIGEKERIRIGKDLHDELGQLLTGISFKTEAVRKEVGTKLPSIVDDIDEINSLIGKAKDFTRFLSRGLLSTLIKEDNIVEALNHLAADIEEIYNISCNVVCDTYVQINNQEAIAQLYRIAQEAITNAIKHGSSDVINIDLCRKNEFVMLSIKDNGTGSQNMNKNDKGLGLQIMEYRANFIGAILEVTQEVAGGTLVTCTLKDKDVNLDEDL